eukprot:TRINITY_DN5098_c0_g1_i4.p1 TRINITY_DN5098_c0_g1~~TRINITY_DN5098_c0_g1_i4.p1  ORF type:complete len:591 (+),score=157.00 TRINITY_DN5098_c0_g1_i4:181-1953(+)
MWSMVNGENPDSATSASSSPTSPTSAVEGSSQSTLSFEQQKSRDPEGEREEVGGGKEAGKEGARRKKTRQTAAKLKQVKFDARREQWLAQVSAFKQLQSPLASQSGANSNGANKSVHEDHCPGGAVASEEKQSDSVEGANEGLEQQQGGGTDELKLDSNDSRKLLVNAVEGAGSPLCTDSKTVEEKRVHGNGKSNMPESKDEQSSAGDNGRAVNWKGRGRNGEYRNSSRSRSRSDDGRKDKSSERSKARELGHSGCVLGDAAAGQGKVNDNHPYINDDAPQQPSSKESKSNAQVGGQEVETNEKDGQLTEQPVINGHVAEDSVSVFASNVVLGESAVPADTKLTKKKEKKGKKSLTAAALPGGPKRDLDALSRIGNRTGVSGGSDGSGGEDGEDDWEAAADALYLIDSGRSGVSDEGVGETTAASLAAPSADSSSEHIDDGQQTNSTRSYFSAGPSASMDSRGRNTGSWLHCTDPERANAIRRFSAGLQKSLNFHGERLRPEYKCGFAGMRSRSENGRAWRPDDLARPNSLPPPLTEEQLARAGLQFPMLNSGSWQLGVIAPVPISMSRVEWNANPPLLPSAPYARRSWT